MSKEIENIEKLMNDKNVEFRDFKLTKVEVRKNDDDTESLVIEGVPCVFDVETVLVFPWAVVMKEVGLTAFIEIVIFFLILGLGLLYAWKKDALVWE